MVKATKSPTLTKTITFQVSPVMLKQLEKAAVADGRSLSSLLRVALSDYLWKLDDLMKAGQ